MPISICARRNEFLCGQSDSPLFHRLYRPCSTSAVENFTQSRLRWAKLRHRMASDCRQRRGSALSTGLYRRRAQRLWKTGTSIVTRPIGSARRNRSVTLLNPCSTRSKWLIGKHALTLIHRLYRYVSTAVVENPIAKTTMPPEGGIVLLHRTGSSQAARGAFIRMPSRSASLSRISRRSMIRSSAERSEERRVGKECRSRWSPYH